MFELPSEEFALGHLKCSLMKTADGSYSLRYKSLLSDDAQWTEPMHSSKGAWSETLHVYLPALTESASIARGDELWRVTSIGLGLGYNEILTAALALKNKLRCEQLRLVSFESEAPLQQAFQAYFSDQQRAHTETPLHQAYKSICKVTSSHFSLDEQILHTFIGSLLKSRALEFHGQLDWELINTLDTLHHQSHCVLFDAFSPESSPLLWDERLLDKIVTTFCGPCCRFVSYASRTALKRVLISNGFDLTKKRGFAGKRECTFASRPRIKKH